MRGRSEVKLVRFVEHGRENVGREHRRRPENLESVRTFFRDELGKLAALLRRIDRSAVPRSFAGEDVRHDSWRDNLVFRAAVALVQTPRSEEHTSELQSPCNIVCRLLLEKK